MAEKNFADPSFCFTASWVMAIGRLVTRRGGPRGHAVASPDGSAVPASLIEKAGCYYRHYGYYPHGTTGSALSLLRLVRHPLPLALVGDA